LTPTLKIFLSIYKVPSQSSLLQAKQAQLPQPFLVGDAGASITFTEVMESPHELTGWLEGRGKKEYLRRQDEESPVG